MKKSKKQYFNIKKIAIITLIAILLLSLIGVFRVYATGDTFAITNAEVSEKSETIDVKELSFEKTEVNSNIIYHKVGDYVKYKITVQNNDSQNYTIAGASDNNENEFITYDYSDFEGKELKANETADLYVSVKYLKELEDVTKRTQEMNVKINVALRDESGNIVTEDIKINSNNPKTGDPITIYMTTAFISAVGLIILVTTGKNSKTSKKGKQLYGIILALVILAPVTVKAAGNALTLNFKSTFELNDKIVVTCTNELTGEKEQKIIEYNEKLPVPDDLEKEGYEFIGWFDENGDKITDETTITGDITLEGKFEPIEYTIEYNLNYGMVESENPVKYTIESNDITLNNPTRTGYTFKGWSGTGLTGDTNTSVTVAQGSTGDRSYTANYKGNTYYIRFNSNGGSGSMSNQTMTYGTPANLTANSFTKTGLIFKEWNTASNGTGESYNNRESVSNLTTTNGATIDLYAQWEEQPTKYAVQIYGINQDVDSSGNTLGLTFGPATGADYNNAYVTHKYEEIAENPGTYNVKIVTHTVDSNGRETTSSTYLTNSSGNKVTRTQEQVTARENISLHDMTWAQIAAVGDKTVFEDSMLCGDTKSVSLTLNSTIGSGSVYNQYGDGAGALVNSINKYYRRWNPSPSENSYVGTGVTLDSNETSRGSNARNAGGYSVSHVRATLIGENTKTDQRYAGDMNLSSDTSLYSCIADDLKAVITPKKIKYATGTSASSFRLNDDISDSIWLFSDREMYGTGRYSGSSIEGLGSGGDGYARFSNTESKYYMSSYNDETIKVSGVYLRKVFNEDSSLFSSWLSRSINLDYTTSLRGFTYAGGIHNLSPSGGFGVSFGFCIR